MYKMEMVVSGSGDRIYMGEYPSMDVANIVVKRFDDLHLQDMYKDSDMTERELLILSRWEGCDVYVTDTDGKQFLNTSENEWEQF